jgi:hypothetical protein
MILAANWIFDFAAPLFFILLVVGILLAVAAEFVARGVGWLKERWRGRGDPP